MSTPTTGPEDAPLDGAAAQLLLRESVRALRNGVVRPELADGLRSLARSLSDIEALRWMREVREAKSILDAAMTEHADRQRDPLYRAIELAFRALPLLGESSIAFGISAARETERRTPA